MADIVSTLFGLPSLDNRAIEQEARTRDVELGTLYGNAVINPYGDPAAQQLLAKQQASQFALGGVAGRAIGGLFGLKTPEQKRAADIKGVLQSTQEEVGSQEPAILYPAMAKRLADMGYSEEAFKVNQVGQEAKMEQGKAIADMSYKRTMAEYTQLLAINQEAAYESKLMEQRGQIAFGALNQIKGAATPETSDKIWNATLEGLKAKGLDVSSLTDLPTNEREKTLESIVESSQTSATRSKEEVAMMRDQFSREKLAQDMAMKQQSNDLRAAIANLQAQMNSDRIAGADRRAIENRLAQMETKKDTLDIQIANRINAEAASKTNSPEFNKQLKGFIQEGLGIKDKRLINSVTTDFNVLYTDFLGQRGPDGMPVNSPEAALAKAKKAIQDRVGKEETLGGFGRDKTIYDTKKPIKLD
jgi:hypothetical protein